MIRVLLVMLAFLSPLLWPYPITLLLSFVASLAFMPAALIAGIITDLAYFVPGASVVPLASSTGLALSVAALFVRRFARARLAV